MKMMNLFLVMFSLILFMGNVTRADETTSTNVEIVKINNVVLQPLLLDEVKISFSAVDKAENIVIPKLNDDLGPLDQAVILIRFGIENWKALGGLGGLSLILLLLISFLKSQYGKNIFKTTSPGTRRFVVAVLGQVVGITGAMFGGALWYEALVTGLFISGGAVAIFEAGKPLFKKK